MTIQEAQDFFAASDFSDITKSKIAKLLEGKKELDNQLILEIKELMQSELDQDFKDEGIDVSNTPEDKKSQAEYDAALDEIESDLQQDMNFVETELNDLEVQRKEVMKISDEMEADAIKQSI